MRGPTLSNKDNSILFIKQDNAITNSYHSMSATEQNIMHMLLSKLRDDDPVDKIYLIHVKDLEELTNSHLNYSHLKFSTLRLLKKLYSIRVEDKIFQIAPLAACRYKKGGATMELELSEEIRSFLFALKNNYTLFQLRTILSLKSKYSKRMYEMLSQFKNTGIFKISVEELKMRFELISVSTAKETYVSFGEFARKALEVAKKEINEHAEISFDYITKKTGRKITNLEFRISCKKEVREELVESISLSSELKTLKERLITKFRLSKTLAKEVIENISIGEIEEIMKLIVGKEQAGRKEIGGLRSIGAYSTTLFQNRLDGATITAQKPNSLKYKYPKSAYQTPVATDQKPKESEEKPIEYHNILSGRRSDSSVSIGEHLAQTFSPNRPTPTHMPISKEEENLKNEKYGVWRKLYHDFKLIPSDVDSLTSQYSLEKLKAAISKVAEELEEQEISPESGHIIQFLKKHLNLV